MDSGCIRIYIESTSQRIKCNVHGIHTEKVSWARHHSSFTRNFENTVAWMTKNLSKTDKKLYRAYCLKENLRTLIKLPEKEIEEALKQWLWKASHSRISVISFMKYKRK